MSESPTVSGGQVWASPVNGSLWITLGKPFRWDEGSRAPKSIKLTQIGMPAQSRVFIACKTLRADWTHMPAWEDPRA